MTKLADLLAQKATIEKKISQAQRAERGEVVARIRKLMADYGLTLADLGQRAVPARASSKAPATKLAPKYRHPDTGQTWSGRGLRPNWLKAELAADRRLDEFKV